jgi:hypothetical protein
MWKRNLLFIGLVLSGLASLWASLFPLRAARNPEHRAEVVAHAGDIDGIVAAINDVYRRDWHDKGLVPAPAASPFTISRRLSLALTGTIPSIEEIRQLEKLPADQQVPWWVDYLLQDRRFSDYFAERLARAYVGTDEGPFLVFRRRRFVTWLSDQVQANRPYGSLVEQLISSDGLWTDQPATNFITATFENDKGINVERLAQRVARTFLGIRLDCAQCHDHPFDDRWQQKDFHGLAAFFGPTRQGLTGIYDDRKAQDYTMEVRKGKDIERVKVEPAVPFDAELLPGTELGRPFRPTDNPRHRLARWVTRSDWVDRPPAGDAARVKEYEGYQSLFVRHHPADLVRQLGQRHPNQVLAYNTYFARATVQRVWALLFNQPMLESVESMSSLEDPPVPLVLLALDFAEHNYDLHRLIRVIAATQVFQLDSASPLELLDTRDSGWAGVAAGSLGLGVLRDTIELQQKHWATFPLSRLRPEQVVGAVQQASSLRTINTESALLIRLAFYSGEKEFVKRYGDTGEDEFSNRGGTIPQRLLLMNGELVREKTKNELFNAANLIAKMAPTDRAAVDTAYQAVLTRRPSLARVLGSGDRKIDEGTWWERRIAGSRGNDRAHCLEDLYWALINTTEFSWNH